MRNSSQKSENRESSKNDFKGNGMHSWFCLRMIFLLLNFVKCKTFVSWQTISIPLLCNNLKCGFYTHDFLDKVKCQLVLYLNACPCMVTHVSRHWIQASFHLSRTFITSLTACPLFPHILHCPFPFCLVTSNLDLFFSFLLASLLLSTLSFVPSLSFLNLSWNPTDSIHVGID